MISNKIMKLEEFKNSIIYRASCDCGSKKCDLVIDVEIDEKFNMILLNLYKDLYWSSYWKSNNNWFIDKWLRIKAAIRILFLGYIEVEESFIMKENQIDDFLKAINEGKNKLKKIESE